MDGKTVPVSGKLRDGLVALTGFLWIYLVVVSWLKDDTLAFTGLFAAVALVVIYFVLGTTRRDRMGVAVPLVYPILLMGVAWAGAFVAAYVTRGQRMDLILGMHPGMFWVTLLYWIATLATCTLGYFLYFDKYLLSDEDWNAFLADVERSKKATEPQEAEGEGA
jgi:hypothetical protein